ncbi:MAG: HAMP domain-containing histidine kinase [Clostridiales bacterium]|jgi:two-component system sensor histidine kinase ArlS|nr:HAMP domain-containing histidine kinase [Clostridiales bacterium]
MSWDNFLEFLRKTLVKIILPIKNKREKWLSNFRFSILFRISLGYIRLLVVYGIVLMAGIFTIYMLAEKEDYNDMAQDIIASIGEAEGRSFINPYYMQNLSMKIEDADTGEEIYNDIAYVPTSDKAFFHGIHFDRKSERNILVVNEEKEFTANGRTYHATFQYDLTGSYKRFLSMLWKLIILYAAVTAVVIVKGRKRSEKLFEPLGIMSATASRLTAHNLHSERLNVEGTQNELKDLAKVINDMLDRIETSYESQKQFVSDASHELRTPIAVIQGYANLLDRWGAQDKEVLEESIQAIQNESRSMQDLVDKLLFLSRHDKKTLKLKKTWFNMKPVVEDMVRETKLVAPDRIINSSILEDVTVYGDKQALKQAIRIFIDNAVKYSREGDEINIMCENRNGDCVITVSDTGIGMTRKDVEHIFDRFYRSEYVRNQNISGHGLGLSLAKLIILAHTGSIKVRTQFTKGTSFTVVLPERKLLT